MEKRAVFDKWWIGIAFAVPQILLIFTFFYWPAGEAVYWAFTLQRPWGGGTEWVGLANFAAVLGDPIYWGSILRSIVFALASTGLAIGGAFVLAVVTDRELSGSKSCRSLFVWPYAIAAPALGLAFSYILSPDAGIMAGINHLIPGFWDPVMNGTHAMIAVIVAYSWKYIGYNFIFLLSALQAVPRSQIEAAALDGAGVLRRVVDIQLPLLTPTLFFLIVMNITESFQDSFGVVDVMTRGGPARATELMVYKIYFDGFKGLDYSGAAAQSIILMLLVMVLTFFQFRYIERRVHYH